MSDADVSAAVGEALRQHIARQDKLGWVFTAITIAACIAFLIRTWKETR